MSAQALQEDDLLELLLQLKKTTPDQARIILNSQPQIAFALMAVMVNINAVNMEVVQKTLSAYGTLPAATPAAQQTAPPVPTAATAIPPHLAVQPPQRSVTPTYPPQPQPSAYAPPSYPAHNTTPNSYASSSHQPPAYSAPPPTAPTAMIPDALANIPDDQKALIMKVISMSREEIYQLPYAQRDNIIQLRATLGLPT
ncbi:hypothetical protein BKA93DRAFT_767232 [Sparassis latifolia]|uniref:Uncharacterized protein n=1 Tax=Sparassis crispa TaxID=139825 RepID=A0A401G5N8_9APHY|nr:hypothetical protein SCP_0103420 [Sparassis crispa]GBE77467.1 hypothetical protein SCP_0103420 [Sparassis crispa]